MGDALRGGQVVLRRRRGGRDLLVFEGVQQVLAAVLLVAVLDDGPQRLSPGHLPVGGAASAHVRIIRLTAINHDMTNSELIHTFKKNNQSGQNSSAAASH